MIKFLAIPLYSYFLMMLYGGLMGRELLLEYPVGNPLLLVEEYYIICAIAFVITTIRVIWRKYGTSNND